MKTIRTRRFRKEYSNWSNDNWYNLQVWRKLSKAVAIEKPLCEICEREGVIRTGEVRDHHRPRRLFPELSLVKSNITNMCKSHHSKKSMLERDCQTKESWEKVIQSNDLYKK